MNTKKVQLINSGQSRITSPDSEAWISVPLEEGIKVPSEGLQRSGGLFERNESKKHDRPLPKLSKILSPPSDE